LSGPVDICVQCAFHPPAKAIPSLLLSRISPSFTRLHSQIAFAIVKGPPHREQEKAIIPWHLNVKWKAPQHTPPDAPATVSLLLVIKCGLQRHAGPSWSFVLLLASVSVGFLMSKCSGVGRNALRKTTM